MNTHSLSFVASFALLLGAASGESGCEEQPPVECDAGPIGEAKSIYVSLDGSDENDGSLSSPYGTLAFAQHQLAPGDTLVIGNGRWTEPLHITDICGDSAAPITFEAETDGGVILDGEGVREPCLISEGVSRPHDIVWEGLRCENSSAGVITVSRADDITLRRVSAYHAGPGNYHAFNIAYTDNVLLEDVAASGSARFLYLVYSSTNAVVRRCWGRWQEHSGSPEGEPIGILTTYGSNDSIVENCVAMVDPEAVEGIYQGVYGLSNWANSSHVDGLHRNHFYGNVIIDADAYALYAASQLYPIEDTIFEDTVVLTDKRLGSEWAMFYDRGDPNLLVNRLTMVGFPGHGVTFSPDSSSASDAMTTVQNSVFMNGHNALYEAAPGLQHGHNDFWNVDIPVENRAGTQALEESEFIIEPGFDTQRYGLGAYLFISEGSELATKGSNGGQVGAEVLYRLQLGERTEEALWPWPMENRILDETGISVTWGANGGIWRSLDGVY